MCLRTLYDISVSNLEAILQKDLNRVLEWCNINLKKLNARNTKCNLVGSSHKLSKSIDLHLTISDYKSECVKQYILLGVNLDNNLKWSFHVDNSHKKLTNKVLLLRQIKPLKSYSRDEKVVLQLLYSSYH